MKKLLVSLLVATTAFSLVSCGSGSKDGGTTAGDTGAKFDGEGVNLTVQVEESWTSYYDKVKETVLKEYPKATIDFITIGSFDHLDVLDKTDPTNKDVADVFALPADRLYGLAGNQSLAAIDAEKMAEEVGGFKDFTGGLGGNFKVDGEYLAFPYNIETLLGFVNVENAKAQGVDYSKAIEISSLKEGQLLTVAHDAWHGVAWTNSVGFELLNHDKDGKLYSDATKNWADLTEDQRKMFTALYDYWKLNKDILWDKDAAWGNIDAQFKTGGTDAVKIDGPWATPDVKKLVGDASNLAIIPLTNITVDGKELTHWKGGWGLGVNARVEGDDKKMEVATAFIKEIVNPANAQELFQATGKILPNVDASAYEGIDELDKKVIDATYAGYDAAVNRPLFNEYGQVWSTWQNSLLSWSAQNPADAEAAYKAVQTAFEAMMATFK